MVARVFCTLALAVYAALFASPAFAQSPQTRDYLSELTGARASVLPDGQIVISMDAAKGDLRGLLTVTLSADGAGVWAFAANYIEDLRADGTPIAATDHFQHNHDDPSTPELHREYAQFRRDGAIAGTVTGATLLRAEDGSVTGIRAAELHVSGGSRTFKGATGSGRIGPWASLPGALTLYLSF